MSHTVKITTELRDLEAIRKAAQRVGATFLAEDGEAELYERGPDGKTIKHRGTLVRLPHWHFPLIIDRQTGAIKFDAYIPLGSQIGQNLTPAEVEAASVAAGSRVSSVYRLESEINPLKQFYAVEVAKAAMVRQGYAVRETTTAAGEVRLVAVTG